MISYFVILALLICGCVSEEKSELKLSEIRLEKDLVIQNNSQEYLFENIKDIKIDKTGDIYVLDQRAANIKVFDNSGNFIKIIGNKGKGPGEFIRPVEMEFFNDTLIVSDSDLRRFSYFDNNGNYIKSKKLTNDQPGTFEISSENMILNSSTVMVGIDTKKTLINSYNRDFELMDSFGEAKQFKHPFKNYVMNFSNFVLTSEDKIVQAFVNRNQLQFIEKNKNIVPVERELFFEPEPPEFKFADKSFSARLEDISTDLDVDNRDRIYVLTRYQTDEDIKTTNCSTEQVIEIYDRNGTIQEIIPIENYKSYLISINKTNNKIFTADNQQMKINRYKAIF